MLLAKILLWRYKICERGMIIMLTNNYENLQDTTLPAKSDKASNLIDILNRAKF